MCEFLDITIEFSKISFCSLKFHFLFFELWNSTEVWRTRDKTIEPSIVRCVKSLDFSVWFSFSVGYDLAQLWDVSGKTGPQRCPLSQRNGKVIVEKAPQRSREKALKVSWLPFYYDFNSTVRQSVGVENTSSLY